MRTISAVWTSWLMRTSLVLMRTKSSIEDFYGSTAPALWERDHWYVCQWIGNLLKGGLCSEIKTRWTFWQNPIWAQCWMHCGHYGSMSLRGNTICTIYKEFYVAWKSATAPWLLLVDLNDVSFFHLHNLCSVLFFEPHTGNSHSLATNSTLGIWRLPIQYNTFFLLSEMTLFRCLWEYNITGLDSELIQL